MNYHDDTKLDGAKRVSIVSLLQTYGIQHKKAGAKEIKIICPHPDHKDTDESCYINTEKNQFKCHGCGWAGSAIDFVMGVEGVGCGKAVGILTGEDRKYAAKRAPLKPVGTTVKKEKEYSPCEQYKTKQYDYCNAGGEKVYASIRYDFPDGKKEFRLATYNGKVLTLGLKGDVPRVPYMLDEFPDHEEIWVSEGEKCADALCDLGIFCTCFAGGSKAWREEYVQYFKDKHVVYLPDNDTTGREFMAQASKAIGEMALSGRILDVGTARDKKGYDIYDKIHDFKKAGMSPAQIRERLILMKRASLYIHDGEAIQILDYDQQQAEYQLMLTLDGFDLSRFIPDLYGKVRKIIPGDCICFMGETASGKTALLQSMSQWFAPMTTLIFNIELSTGVFFERTASIATEIPAEQIEVDYLAGKIHDNRGELGHIYSAPISTLTTDEIRRQFWKFVRFKKVWPEWVAIDYVQLIKGMGPRYERMSDVSEEMRILAKELNTRIIFTSQKSRPPKSGKEQGDRAPSLHDAKDSGSLESSASLLIDVRSHPEYPDVKIGTVLKNTRGQAGFQFEMRWIGACTKFVAGSLERPDRLPPARKVKDITKGGSDDDGVPF